MLPVILAESTPGRYAYPPHKHAHLCPIHIVITALIVKAEVITHKKGKGFEHLFPPECFDFKGPDATIGHPFVPPKFS